MAATYLPRLTAPQLRQLRLAAEDRSQHLTDNDMDPDCARDLGILRRASEVLEVAAAGQPDDAIPEALKLAALELSTAGHVTAATMVLRRADQAAGRKV